MNKHCFQADSEEMNECLSEHLPLQNILCINECFCNYFIAGLVKPEELCQKRVKSAVLS